MDRFNDDLDKEMTDILDRMTSKNNFWPEAGDNQNKKIPRDIWHQRLGVELHEEDFVPAGHSSKGFQVRDRTEAKKYQSGFSRVTNEDEEFKVELDVWPFLKEELSAWVTPGKFFTIRGRHEPRPEDNSQCSRNFQRYYCLPKGESFVSCAYRDDFVLTVTADKTRTDDEGGPHLVHITRDTRDSTKGVRIGDKDGSATHVRDVPITIVDVKNEKETAPEVPIARVDPEEAKLIGAMEQHIDSLKEGVVKTKILELIEFLGRRNSKEVEKDPETSVDIPVASESSSVEIQVEGTDDGKKTQSDISNDGK